MVDRHSGDVDDAVSPACERVSGGTAEIIAIDASETYRCMG
jgi:hypothetical protein